MKFRSLAVFLAGSALLLGATAYAQQQPAAQQPGPPPAPPFGMPIGLEQAMKAAAAAEQEAKKIDIKMSIAVVEPSGDLVYFRKMDGAPYFSIQIAQAKAWTAARYRRPTKAFFDGIQAGNSFFLTFPGINAAPGGAPIVADGKLVGAIGVSGGNGDQDIQVVTAGTNAVK
jgi:uncharacterized protein GlcG (DUF336 family)